MQLIRIRPNGKIEIIPEAISAIASVDGPIGFVSLVGKTRTGKSCLLNRLLHLTGDGVKVSLDSFEWILRLRAALRVFGCGLSPSLINSSTATSSFSVMLS